MNHDYDTDQERNAPNSRRNVLQTIAGIGLGIGTGGTAAKLLAGNAEATSPTSPAAPSGLLRETSIARQADKVGVRFGAAAVARTISDSQFAALILNQCDVTLPANGLKWGLTNPSGPQADYSTVDPFIDWAHSHGLRQRGHTLIWDKPKNVPSWVLEDGPDASRLAARIRQRCSDACTRYRGRIQSWDVVNEAINPNHGTPFGGPLYKALGWEFADHAFQAAHEADPEAQLVYNDHPLPGGDKHQAGILRLLEGMLKRGVQVHAFGIQGHLWIPTKRSDDAGWRNFLAEVADLGLEILITELDVVDNGPQDNPGRRDRAAGDHLQHFMEITLDQPAVREVVCRSLSDKYEGLSYAIPREDKIKRRPSPFNAKMEAKPIARALSNAFGSARSR